MNKVSNLYDIVKINSNENLSQKYIKYLLNWNDSKQYRHDEIMIIFQLLSALKIPYENAAGFYYSYEIPQLNKEFDLIKITEKYCINIEIKGGSVSQQKIIDQLKLNQHYLKILQKKFYSFTFLSKPNKLFFLNNDSLNEIEVSFLKDILISIGKNIQIDLDAVFSPKNILVSPLNSPQRFLNRDYILTENQQYIKTKILNSLNVPNSSVFFGLTGNAGTGKTLLLYDLANELAKQKDVLMIHSGILCDGHWELNNNVKSLKIISAKELKYKEIKNIDVVMIDESHRLYESALDKVEKWVVKAKALCVFSFDKKQMLSKAEKRRQTMNRITNLCDPHIFELTNKIRTNKELSLFITCLFDLSKMRKEYKFNNVEILYESSKKKAVELAKLYELEGFTYISYTPSLYYGSLDYQKNERNTHNVIGQEFDKVCMILNNNFYYDNKRLIGCEHPNPDYIFEQLLYQGLTRVRTTIRLIITEENLLESILTLFE